jgi:hypothetical protein
VWVDLAAPITPTPNNIPELKAIVDAIPAPAKAPDGGAAAAAAAGSSGAPPAAAAGGGAAPAAAASSSGQGGGGGGEGKAKHHGHHGRHGHHGHKKAAPPTDAARHLALTDVEARADQIIAQVRRAAAAGCDGLGSEAGRRGASALAAAAAADPPPKPAAAP